MTVQVSTEPGADWATRYAGACRDHYRRVLLDIARADPRVICVDSDTGGLEDGFAAQLPDQYVNVGIAEANLMGVAAGLAATGRIPFVNTISSFAATRACEQLKIDVAGNNLPVKVVVTHGGLSGGHYGPTHHALEDMAIVRTLPHLTVVVPADAAETERAVRAIVSTPGPVFLRLGRSATPMVHERPYEFRLGEAVTVRSGDDVTIVATGPYPVHFAVQAHERLAERGISARVLDLHTIKPLDEAAIVAAASQTRGIVTVEDHLRIGGLGGAVAEVVTEHRPCPVRRIGVADGFHDEVGSELELLTVAGVSVERVVAAAAAL
ncbi:transketolase family protein [Paractinoplanes rhizophilus]|uniref:Transketolase family protein n=1 Tax=Paractinoplanes rhizophilus TaxID=1416877 RepID=A0ABW2HW05_9ACTN